MSAKGGASRFACESPAERSRIDGRFAEASLKPAPAYLRFKDGSAKSHDNRNTRRRRDSSRTRPPSNRKIHSRSRNGRRNRSARSVCCSWCEILGVDHSARARNPTGGELARKSARHRRPREKCQLRARAPAQRKPLPLFAGQARDKTCAPKTLPGKACRLPGRLRVSLRN